MQLQVAGLELVWRDGYQAEESLRVLRLDHVAREEDRLPDHEAVAPPRLRRRRRRRRLSHDGVVTVHEVLDLGDLDDGVKISRDIGDLDDLGVYGGAGRLLGGAEALQALVVVGEEGAEAGDVAGTVLVDADLGGAGVGLDEGLEE